MSFSFSLVGTREEVLAQLEARDKRYGGVVADRAAGLIAATMTEEKYTPGSVSGYETRYVVDVSGHTGDTTSASSLTLSISSRYITIALEEAKEDEPAAGVGG